MMMTSKVNTVTFISETVDSNAGPTALTAIPGSTKLTPVDINADNLASMIGTVDTPSDSSSDSSSNSSISEDPPNDTQEGFLDFHKVLFSGTYYMDPLADMEAECPKEAPDPVMDDATMPDYSTTPLSSVGDQQQTLGDGPPTAPPKEPTNLGPALAGPGRWV